MDSPYVEPSYKLKSFNCPFCNAFAHQEWYQILRVINDQVSSLPSYNTYETSPSLRVGATGRYVTPRPHLSSYETYLISPNLHLEATGHNVTPSPRSTSIITKDVLNVGDSSLSRCNHCGKYAFWIRDKMIYPVVSLAPLPSEDMPEDVKEDFLEARNIVELSPRSSSALLRLALQKLMIHLGESGENLNQDIGNLVKKGLPSEIQQALDVVRVVGNESVHPGTLNLKDDKETASSLFGLLNFIVYDRITRKKEIESLYSKLPQLKLEGIQKRDTKK